MTAAPLVAVTRKTAVALAPPVMPRTSGLANGLRAIDWVSAPEIPSAAPTIRPTSARGIRRSMITNSSTRSPCPKIVLKTAGSSIVKSPTEIDTQNTRNVSAARATVTSTTHGRQTHDQPPTRTPGCIPEVISVVVMPA